MYETVRQFKGVWIPKEVWLDEKLTYFEKAVYAEIDSLDGEDGCFASNKYFQSFFKCTERTISRAISHLQQLGYIEVTVCNGRKRVIKMSRTFSESSVENFSHFVENSAPTVDKNVYGRQKCLLSVDTNVYPDQTQMSTPISYNIDDNIAYISSSDDDDKNKVVVVEREKIKKSCYGCFFSEEQEEDLLERLSIDEFDYYCKKLSAWKKKNPGKTCRSDYKIILQWAKEDRQTEE